MTIKNFKKILPHKFQGFTIIETLIAIAIISVGLGGVLGLVSYVISISRMSSTEIIAANLAQEGIEVIRNIRDSNWLADIADGPPEDSVSYIQHIGEIGAEKAGRLNYDTKGPLDKYIAPPAPGNIIKKCGSDCRLYLKDGFYSHDDTGEETNFYRLIILKEAGARLKVKSVVAWEDQKGNRHQIILEDDFYDYTMPGSPRKFIWELTNPVQIKDCAWLKNELSNQQCTIVGGAYHHQKKCGKCCFDIKPICNSYLYIAPWDVNAVNENPDPGESPEVPAFLGDPAEVCDIYEDSGVYKCRVFEKIELEY